MNYHLLREAADSWGLVFLALVFLFAIWRALRPSAREHHHAASLIPLNDESLDND